jgi:hypothetical protein
VSDTDSYATISNTLDSLATLKYLGYNDTAAHQIWAKWSTWPPGGYAEDPWGELPFLEAATSHLIRGRDHDTWDDDDQLWRNCMDICGIEPVIQALIMDPMYKTIRLTESCCFWMKDTIELRYRGLEAIEEDSRNRAKALERAPRSGQSGPPFQAHIQGTRSSSARVQRRPESFKPW